MHRSNFLDSTVRFLLLKKKKQNILVPIEIFSFRFQPVDVIGIPDLVYKQCDKTIYLTILMPVDDAHINASIDPHPSVLILRLS